MLKLVGFFLVFFSLSSLSQEEFSFTLYFEDALGNKDSLIIGYDENGNQFLDSQFGEIDIVNEPWDSVFEIRASEAITEDYLNWPINSPPIFNTKKQIINRDSCSDCNDYATWIDSIQLTGLSINIKTSNWPLTLSWDSTIFNNNSCVYGTYFTFNMFYTSLINKTFLADNKTQNALHNSILHKIVSDLGDTINVMWLFFCDSRPPISTINTIIPDFEIYPNPAFDKLYIDSPFPIDGISIVDISGKETSFKIEKLQDSFNAFDISLLESGLYVLKIEAEIGNIIKPFIKL